MPTPPRTIDEVIGDLDRVVDTELARGSRMVVFPAMYRTVTRTVRGGLAADFFERPDRVEPLVVRFADLYLEAHDAWEDGPRPPESWELAFTYATQHRGSVLQHLLLGMNAHINLDLGIATAAVSTSEDHADLRADFVRVNDILFALLDELQGGVGALSPWLGRLDRVGLGWDEACMRLGIRTAREEAWDLSEQLVALDDAAAAEAIAERDRHTARLGGLLCRGWSPFTLGCRVVGARECRDLARITEVLSGVRIDLGATAG
jgi:hypothetical protein